MKYGPNFRQNLDPAELDRLPEWCTYEGAAEDLRHLLGILIPTKDVERIVYVGERENIYVTMPDGRRDRPWMGCYITELDAHGNVKLPEDKPNPWPKYGPEAMSTADLAELGMSDADLAALAKSELGEDYEPDRTGPSDKRRDVFKRAMAKVYG